MKIRSFLLACAIGLMATTPAASASPVQDAAGRPIDRSPQQPQRILIGSGPLLHAVMAIEAGAGNADRGTSRIIAVGADFRSRDKEGSAQLQALYPALAKAASIRFGEIAGLGPDELLALRPDLAILSGTDSQPRAGSLAEALLKAGVPVVFTDFRSHPGQHTLTSLRAIATALGHDPDANGFLQFQSQQMAKVTDITGKLPAAKRPRTFMDMRAEAGKDCCGTPGKGNYGELIEAAGGTNIGAEIHDNPLGRAEPAQIIASKATVYVAGSSNGGVPLGRGADRRQAATALDTLMAARAPVIPIPALEQQHGIAVWHSFYNHPFNVAVVQALATEIHPELFGTLNPDDTLKAAFNFIGIEPGGTYWVSTRN